MESKIIKKIPFDQYSRQIKVLRVINAIRGDSDKSFNILDVGGYKGNTSKFLKDDKITVLDLFDAKEEGYIKGSALDMPLQDGQFDIVVSFDVLEHIEKKDRDRFYDECIRVSKTGVIIAAPQKTSLNEGAELFLNNMYKEMHGVDHQWLSEHIANGLPDFAKTEEYFTKKGFRTTKIPSNDLMNWLLMQGEIFINSKHSIASEEIVKLNNFYNKLFDDDASAELKDSYRVILCSFKDKELHERVKKDAKSRLVSETLTRNNQLAIIKKMLSYQSILSGKMSQLATDYKGLYENEKAVNEELLKKIEEAKEDETHDKKFLNRFGGSHEK